MAIFNPYELKVLNTRIPGSFPLLLFGFDETPTAPPRFLGHPRHHQPSFRPEDKLEYARDLRRPCNNGLISRPEFGPRGNDRRYRWWKKSYRALYHCKYHRRGAERDYKGRQYQRHLRYNQGEFCCTA